MAYSILFKQCGSDHMTRGRSRAVDRIVVHFTATLASARNNATYFARNEGQGASAHYFVDDITPEIYQSVAEGDTAWHAGDWQMNCRGVPSSVLMDTSNSAESSFKVSVFGTVSPVSQRETACRVTKTFSASSSCERPLPVLSS